MGRRGSRSKRETAYRDLRLLLYHYYNYSTVTLQPNTVKHQIIMPDAMPDAHNLESIISVATSH